MFELMFVLGFARALLMDPPVRGCCLFLPHTRPSLTSHTTTLSPTHDSLHAAAPDTLLTAVLKATMERSGVAHSELGDITVGNVQMGGSYAGPARMAQFAAGIPETVPLYCVNRQCSSGLQACADVRLVADFV